MYYLRKYATDFNETLYSVVYIKSWVNLIFVHIDPIKFLLYMKPK